MTKTVYIDCSPFMLGLLQEVMPDCAQKMVVNVGDPDAEGIVSLAAEATTVLNGHTMMDEPLLARLPHLREIIFLGSGATSYIDVAAAERQGIRVRTISGYGDRSVAEHATALMFAATRKIATMDRELRAGHWEPLEGMELAGRRLGIIGFGGIGQTFAEIGEALGMAVSIWNRSPLPPRWSDHALPLDELLSQSDVISLHLALNDTTRGMIGAARLALMKPTSILINTARAGLIDSAALRNALEKGRIAHAALDVFDEEPLPATSPWFSLSNVTLTAHAGFKTADASRRLLRTAVEMLVG
ncbi:NAD(P)-dependent oxidoreductase [Neorhizobium sp. NCHU2750]|uniref:NAD(P)-dependent oxidoreductase n=1 Tax=Neorhizobium sp. NCHU2750 TaxID=1825976 RepID=UPI000E71757A|nr:D-3-phosphoglycerate dehydrogenase [Neorhizobium sp. NCHU2750]